MFKLMHKKIITILRSKMLFNWGPMYQWRCLVPGSLFQKCSADAFILVAIIKIIGVAPITLLRMCVLKIVTLKGGHLMW